MCVSECVCAHRSVCLCLCARAYVCVCVNVRVRVLCRYREELCLCATQLSQCITCWQFSIVPKRLPMCQLMHNNSMAPYHCFSSSLTDHGGTGSARVVSVKVTSSSYSDVTPCFHQLITLFYSPPPPHPKKRKKKVLHL